MKAIHRKGHANGLEVKHWNIDFAYQSGLKKKKNIFPILAKVRPWHNGDMWPREASIIKDTALELILHEQVMTANQMWHFLCARRALRTLHW